MSRSYVELKYWHMLEESTKFYKTWSKSASCFTAFAISSWFFSSHFFFLSFCQWLN